MKKVVLTLVGVMCIAFGLAGFFFSVGGKQPEKVVGKVNVSKSFPMAELREIRINTDWQDIRVVPVAGEQVRIHLNGPVYKGAKGDTLEAGVNNGILEIFTRSSRRNHWKFDFFHDVSVNRSTVLELYLPQKYREKLRLEASSGTLTVKGVRLNHLECRASSGDIDAEGFATHQIDLKTSSGQIRVSGAAPQMRLETSSGDIKGGKVTATEIAVSASSGDVEFQTLHGNLKLNTNSGGVACDAFEGNLEATASSGDVNIHYVRFQHQVSITTSSGEVELGLPKSTEFKVEFSSGSGEYHSDFPLTVTGAVAENQITGFVGQASNRIRVQTSSGDFTLRRE